MPLGYHTYYKTHNVVRPQKTWHLGFMCKNSTGERLYGFELITIICFHEGQHVTIIVVKFDACFEGKLITWIFMAESPSLHFFLFCNLCTQFSYKDCNLLHAGWPLILTHFLKRELIDIFIGQTGSPHKSVK